MSATNKPVVEKVPHRPSIPAHTQQPDGRLGGRLDVIRAYLEKQGQEHRQMLGIENRQMLGTENRQMLGTGNRQMLGTENRQMLGIKIGKC